VSLFVTMVICLPIFLLVFFFISKQSWLTWLDTKDILHSESTLQQCTSQLNRSNKKISFFHCSVQEMWPTYISEQVTHMDCLTHVL
jgi:hypothetical protein